MDKLSCEFCGADFESGDGYSDTYCSEECWEADTDYGNEDTNER